MEVAYLENDRNELEITRDVDFDELFDEDDESFSSKLKKITTEVKDFDFDIAESTFNEFNHYFRRIRNVQLKIILGNSASNNKTHLSAELSLTQNRLYLNNKKAIQNRVGVQTIATSTAHLDAHQFEFNFKNDKYNPFEGAGLDSSWTLSIPGINGNQISKVILTISYTARKGT